MVKSLKKYIINWFQLTMRTVFQLRLFILVCIILFIIIIGCGLTIEILGPLPAPDNHAINPLPSIVNSDDGLINVCLNFVQNIFIDGALILTSIIQFGIVAFTYFLVHFFIIGASIGWFGKFPDSLMHGFLSFGLGAILEIITGSLIVSSSFWISTALFRPDDGLSRWSTVKRRYFHVLLLLPIVIVLVLCSVLVEEVVTEPLASKYAKRALMSEEKTNIFGDNKWSIEVPNSWQIVNSEYDYLNQSQHKTIQGSKIPLILDISVITNNYAFEDDEIRQATTDAIARSMEKRGLIIREKANETMVGKLHGYRMTASGHDSSLAGNEIVAVVYYLSMTDDRTQTTSTYTIAFRTDTEWEMFSEQLIEITAQSFRLYGD